MDKKYSSCPLKKRPINVIKEEKETKLEISDSTDTVPVDLTMHKFKTERIAENFYEDYPINYSKVKSSELKRICTTEQQSRLHSTDNSRIQPLRIPTSYHYSPIHSPVESDRNSPHNSSPKDYSQSPIPLTNNYFEFDYQHQDFQSRNFNNNVMKHEIEEDYRDQINYPIDHGILSPPSSHFSYGSGQSDFGDYSEPEDLSIKNKRKVLVSTDSNSNIQRDESERDLYYQCRICNKCYSTYAGLMKHQQCHSIPTELQSSSTYMHIHSSYLTQPTDTTLTSTNNDDKQVQATNNNRPFGAPRYQCKDCGKSYSTFSGLTKHQQFHCPYVEGNQAKKVFSCKNCDKVYVSLGALKMHIRTHTLPCKCPLCGKAFSRPWLLQGHIRTHTGEKPFTCQHCQRAFADRSNLRAHLQTHSEVKKYCCTSCTKTFSRMSLLSKHLQGGCNGTVTSTNDSNSTHIQMVQDHKLNNEDFYYNRNEADYNHRAKESINYENHNSYGGRIQNFE